MMTNSRNKTCHANALVQPFKASMEPKIGSKNGFIIRTGFIPLGIKPVRMHRFYSLGNKTCADADWE